MIICFVNKYQDVHFLATAIQQHLTLCMLGNFSCILSSADFCSKLTFSKRFFHDIIKVSIKVGQEQARQFVGPGLGPDYLQGLSGDDKTCH